MIYLDHAATSLHKPPEVAAAVAEAIAVLGNCSRGVGRPAMRAAGVLYETRELLAELFGVQGAEQIAFTANSTQALNLAVKGILRPGDTVVTTVLEHNSVLRPLYEMEQRGVKLLIVGCDKNGVPDYAQLEQMILSGEGFAAQAAGRTEVSAPEKPGASALERSEVSVSEVSAPERPEVPVSEVSAPERPEVPEKPEVSALERSEVSVPERSEVPAPGKTGQKRENRRNGTGVRAVICTHASNLTGNLVDIRRIGRICRRAGALLVVDASQTAGVIPIDMEKDGIDILCFTGHKGLMGPQGTGGICIRKGVQVRPLLTGGSGIRTFEKTHPSEMPEALEAGTQNAHGIAGLRAALLAIRRMGLPEIRRRELLAARTFFDAVRDIPGIRIYGDFANWDRAAIVSLNLGSLDAALVSDQLSAEYEIETRAGGHCAPLMHEALGTKEQGAVRFSFSCYNTPEEALCAARAVREIAEIYCRLSGE